MSADKKGNSYSAKRSSELVIQTGYPVVGFTRACFLTSLLGRNGPHTAPVESAASIGAVAGSARGSPRFCDMRRRRVAEVTVQLNDSCVGPHSFSTRPLFRAYLSRAARVFEQSS